MPEERCPGTPGRPGSAPDAGNQFDDYVADMLELLDALGIAEAHFLAAATGGTVALLLASARPERVDFTQPSSVRQVKRF